MPALALGATGRRSFVRVTLPSIRWALLYGAVLTTARAVGAFGAVTVVSGNIRGQTNTLPLQVELLCNDSSATGAFASAFTLRAVAPVARAVKAVIETHVPRQGEVRPEGRRSSVGSVVSRED